MTHSRRPQAGVKPVAAAEDWKPQYMWQVLYQLSYRCPDKLKSFFGKYTHIELAAAQLLLAYINETKEENGT